MALKTILKKVLKKTTKKKASNKSAKAIKEKSKAVSKAKSKINTTQLKKQNVKKPDTVGSLKNKMLKAKTYKEYEALRKKLESLEKLKADRKFSRLSKQKQFEKMEDDYMQSRIDSYGDPEMMKSKLAKGGMTMAMKKKTKYMAKGGMKKTKYMAKGGMKKTKMMSRGGAARRK